MSKTKPFLVPQLGVNEKTALLNRWLVEDFTWVEVGTAVAQIETTKTSLDIESDQNGYIRRVVEQGNEVVVGEQIAVLSHDQEMLAHLVVQSDSEKAPAEELETNITRKALALAKELNVNIDELKPSDGATIRTKDVEEKVRAKQPRHPIPNTLEQNAGESPIAIYGAGAGGLTLKEAIETKRVFRPVCFVDDSVISSHELSGLPVYDGTQLADLRDAGLFGVCCEIANYEVRLDILGRCKELGLELVGIHHRECWIAPSAHIGDGTFVKAGAVIETNTQIGRACIIDNGVIVAHDGIISDGVHIAPGASLGGGVRVGLGSVIGIGSSIATGITIGERCIIAPGSSVTKDVSNNSIVEGVPGRIVGERK